MQFGIYVPQIVSQYQSYLEAALAAEQCGFTSFWMYDHMYTPGAPDHPALEAWTTTTALLANTTTLRVGSLVLCNNFRHPALLAKMASTLDVISNGRLDLGIGSGSVEIEHHQLGLPWPGAKTRAAQLGESLEIITRMFRDDRTTFEGEHYRVDDLPNLPKPVQSPRPLIHIGGTGPKYTLPLVARYADVWNVPTYGLGDWTDLRDQLRAECDRIGRDPDEIKVSLELVLAIAPTEAELADVDAQTRRRYTSAAGFGLDHAFIGTPSMIADRIHAATELGVHELCFMSSPKTATTAVHQFAEMVAPLL